MRNCVLFFLTPRACLSEAKLVGTPGTITYWRPLGWASHVSSPHPQYTSICFTLHASLDASGLSPREQTSEK